MIRSYINNNMPLHQPKDEILSLVEKHPKHYTKIIRKNVRLMSWIDQNKLITSDRFIEEIYSAVFQQSNICSFGNKRKIYRFNDGWVGCGQAKSCTCTKNAISDNVKLTKSKFSKNTKKKINDKRKKTMLEKYGVEFNLQRSDIKLKVSKPKIPLEVHNKLSDRHWLKEEYITKKRSQVEIANDLGVYYGTVCEYLKQHNFKIRKKTSNSIIESEVKEFLKELNVPYLSSHWDILGNKEIDIFIPSENLAIEINGLYWHSYDNKNYEDRNRHLNKTILCENLNINLLHITDYEWNNKRNIIKNLIKTKLKLNSKLFARKCSLGSVTNKEAKIFLNQYHIQGYVPSAVNYGLFYNNELVMILTLGENRFNSKAKNMEILRICSKDGLNVVGGLSKILTYAKNIHKTEFISYCARDKSNGNGYKKAGFTLLGNTKPGYYWTDGTNIITRFKSQKKNLVKWLNKFDINLSESENMFNAGFRRYWDCGNLIFKY